MFCSPPYPCSWPPADKRIEPEYLSGGCSVHLRTHVHGPLLEPSVGLAVDLYPPSPTKLKRSRNREERLEYSMATCRSLEERLDLGDFTATCRSRDERGFYKAAGKVSTRRGTDCRERMKLETIKTPAMDPGNEDVISDFLTFVNGKKFYRRKGKTWKRGYLLYEPPGSDGASLIAAMADFLEFNLYNLDLASFSSFSELKNTLLVGAWRSSVIAIRDLDDFDHCAGMLPNRKNELTGSCLLEFVNGLLSSCGDQQIIVFTTNNRDRHDAARRHRFNEDIYVHKSSPQPVALADEGEIVQLDSSRQKPLVDFEATNIKAYQSSLLVSNSEEKNTREASTRRCMTESVCSFVDSMTSISSTDFDALDNRAHLGRAYQSGPIVFNSEKKDTREGLSGECLTKSALSFDDSTKRKSLPFDVNLSSFSEHACQDFDDFDFVGFDCGSGMLPNLKDESDIVLPDGGHILSLSEEKIVRKTLKRKCRTMSVLSLEDQQHHVGWRWEDVVKFLGSKRICRQLVIHCETTVKRIHRQLGTRRWPFKQTAIGLSDGGHILSLSEKTIVRKTLKRKCRSMSVLSLEDHKQHVDGRWEDAAKSHVAKRICRQLVIDRLSTAKRIRKQHGIHRWPFQRSAVGLPDGHILPLSEKKIVRTTLKRKCRSMSVLSLVDSQQHVDRRWEDAAMNIGAKRICRQLVIHCVSIAKRIYRQHGIYHRWPFQQDRGTMKGYTLGVRLSMDGKLVSSLQVIYISWLGRFSPPPSTLPGGEIVGHIVLSSSQFATTNSIAQRVGQDQSGSASSDSENERTREQENPEEIYTSITKDDLQRRMGRMNRKDAAASLGVSVATFKRKCREFGIKRWPHVRKKKAGRPPDQHRERNTSTACKTPLHNVHARMEGELVGQNQEANEFRRDFMEHSVALNTENDSIIAVYSETEAARGSSKWAFQLEGQTMQSTTYPYHDDLVFSQSQIASTEVVNENMGSLQDRRDLLASQVVAPQKEPLLDGHVFGFGNWTVGSCSDLASSQTMRTFSQATGSSENLENWLASVEEHLMEENIYGSSRSDPAPSQPMRTIHHSTATIPHMMSLPTERQDTRSVKLKATYGDTKIKFQFPLTSGINELKEVMSKILERELGSFKVEYKDDDGEWILMALDEHLREYLQLLTSFGNKVTELKVQDKVPNTTNFCDNCRYNCRPLKRKRP